MIATKSVMGWAKNRVGFQTEPNELPSFTCDSLEQNKAGKSFAETVGEKTFWGVIGFIDLKGFSTKSQGLSPKNISNFIKPFLSETIEILTDCGALIDKTIGDEIMFVLPQIENRGLVYFDIFKLLRRLKQYAYKNIGKYEFRIGMSFGDMYLDVIKNDEYLEWFISGEPIIAAKRIMSNKRLKYPNPCILGISQAADNPKDLISFCDGINKFPASEWNIKSKLKKVKAKGIGLIYLQVMEPEK